MLIRGKIRQEFSQKSCTCKGLLQGLYGWRWQQQHKEHVCYKWWIAHMAATIQYPYLSVCEGGSYFFLKMSNFELFFLDQGQSAVNDLSINNEWVRSEKKIVSINLYVWRIIIWHMFIFHKGHAMKDNDRHYKNKEHTFLPRLSLLLLQSALSTRSISNQPCGITDSVLHKAVWDLVVLIVGAHSFNLPELLQ